MIVLVDIGNTNIVIGIAKNNDILETYRISTDASLTCDEYAGKLKGFGIDKENMANQKNLRYTRSLAEALEAVDSGEADCSFILNPTKVEEIRDVALANEKMPQKSTYFYPKLITGLVMNEIKPIE